MDFVDTDENLLLLFFFCFFFPNRLSTFDKRKQISAVTHMSVVLKVFL